MVGLSRSERETMMYQDKLVIAIKSNGTILKEDKDVISIPFGTEYSIFIKNLNTVRVNVNIEIDGMNISEDNSFIIQPNQSIDFERFVKNKNLEQGNKFLFIQRTAAIEQHRGIGTEDGLIRVLFEFEAKTESPSPSPWLRPDVNFPPYTMPIFPGIVQWPQPYYPNENQWEKWHSNLNGTVLPEDWLKPYSSCTIPCAGAIAKETLDYNIDGVGITAPGSISEQKFIMSSSFTTDGIKHVGVLKLMGYQDGKEVETIKSAKQKPKCVSCGKKNKSKAKFCVECGTGLIIV